MRKSLRLAVLVSAITAAAWWTQPQPGDALTSCGSLPRTCSIGATTTCTDGDSIYPCECVAINGKGRWLCFGWFP